MKSKIISKDVKLKDFLKHVKKNTRVDIAVFNNEQRIIRCYGFAGRVRDIPSDLLDYYVDNVFPKITFRFAFYIEILEPEKIAK